MKFADLSPLEEVLYLSQSAQSRRGFDQYL
jgi:hypothetical protein